MKKSFFLLGMVILSQLASAQYALEKGKAQFNFGFGLSEWGAPVFAGADFGLNEDMSLGAEIAFRRFHEDRRALNYNHTVTSIGINWNYHFNALLSIPKQWDVYAGLNAGYYIWNSPDHYTGDHANGSGLGGQIGFRYYFNNRLGINLEGGSGTALSGGKLGLTVKI